MTSNHGDGQRPAASGIRHSGPNRRATLTGASAALVGTILSSSDKAFSQPRIEVAITNSVRPAPNLTLQLAEYAASTSFERLPQAVVEHTKKVVFDEMASAYLGRRTDAGKLIAKYVTQFSCHPEARIYGTNLRASAPYAAMANGTAGHGYEVDGTHVIGGHPGASIVHAVTALAERQRIGGAEMLNAIVLGFDVGVRVVEACGGLFVVRDTKQMDSDFMYSLGGAAASARIMKLEPKQYCYAFALATFQANGLTAKYSEKRHISKSFCHGQHGFAGVSAALMAQVGLEGHEDVIGTKEGLLDAWGDRRNDGAVVQDLGTVFKIMGSNYKFANAGYPIHTPMEAALTLVRQHNISIDAITSILVGMPSTSLKTVDNREMHDISVQDMVSAALTRDGLKLVEEPFPEILSDPTYKRLRGLITARVDPELERDFPNGRGARVTITVQGGQRYSMRIDNPLGHSLRGEVTWEELAGKWRGSLPHVDVDKASSVAQRIDSLTDVTELFDAFSGQND